MHKDQCFYIGYFSKVIGHRGEIALRLDVDDPEWYGNLPILFVQLNKRDHELVPFHLAEVTIQQNSLARLKIEGIDDAVSSKQLVGCHAFLPLDVLPKLSGNKFYFHEIKDFTVLDKHFGIVGKVQEVLEYPQQAILQIQHESGKEVLIPVNDETILSVDREKKSISVNAPEGLIDLYLDA